MSDAPKTAESLQRQMQQVRAEMRADVEQIVANAREMTDWTYYVRTYPWICIGAAAALGYLVVPSRSPVLRTDARDLQELAKQQKIVVRVEDPRSSKPSLLATLVRLAAVPLLQGGLAIVRQQIEQQFKQHVPPDTAASNGNGRAPHYE
jgi:hypothetical protein